jgi:hypothetical protein
MANSPVSRPARPSPWAVGLFVLSSGFAAISIALVSSGYSPI